MQGDGQGCRAFPNGARLSYTGFQRPQDGGNWAEYATDIDYIPADHDWQATDHAPEDAFKLWGPEPPADFVANAEA